MTFSFSPGKPSGHPQAVAQCRWKEHHVVAYTSGNNLIILTRSNLENMQTIYLEQDATAVSINAKFGYIAVCVGNEVRVYEPEYQVMKKPKWRFLTIMDEKKDQEKKRDQEFIEKQDMLLDKEEVNDFKYIPLPIDRSIKTAVSWTLNDELLVGSNSCLTLWQFVKRYNEPDYEIIWRESQSAPVYLADISQTGDYIISCGAYDTLPKIWYRSGSTHFGLVLYRSPFYVTGLRFKKRDSSSIRSDNDYIETFYLIGSDQHLRVLNCGVDLTTSVLGVTLKGTIKLNHGVEESKGFGFVNIIDEYLVRESLVSISKRVYNDELHDLQRLHMDLLLIGSTSMPNITHICTLENVSIRSEKPTLSDVTNLNDFFTPTSPKFPIYSDSVIDDSGLLSTICHDLSSGVIQNVTLDLSFLLTPPSKTSELLKLGTLTHTLTGHVKSIQALARTSDGSALLTTSRFQESAIWRPEILENGVTTLQRKSSVNTPYPIAKAVLLEKGEILVTMCPKGVILWDTSRELAHEVFCYSIHEKEVPICFTSLPSGSASGHDIHYLIAVYPTSTDAFVVTHKEIRHIEVDNIHDISPNIKRISTIDTVTVNLSKRYRPIISTIDVNGILRCFAATYSIEDNYHTIKFTETHRVETNITNASYIRGSSIGKFAIAQGQSLGIWDLNTSLREYTEYFTDEIKDIDWSGTPFGQSILAVGFQRHCLLYTQLRYDYTNKNPSYLAIKKIDISDFTTHSIGDSIWLSDAVFVIGSGNQLYVNDKALDLKEDTFTKQSIGSRNIGNDNNILSLCCVLNGPVPLYHPQLLIQALFQGKLELVKEILLRLFLRIREIELKSEDIEQIGSFFGFNIEKFWDVNAQASENNFPEPYTEFNPDIADVLKEKLAMRHSLPYLTRHQQITLVNTIEAVLLISQNKLQLDSNGLKFFLAVKLTQLSLHQASKKLSWRDLNWALHSENKELLLFMIRSSALKASESNFNWATAVRYGLSHWVRHEDLLKLFEEIAKTEFTSNPEDRDVTKCAIFYLALKKKQILLVLWKTSYGNPEQQKMLNFLKNDFKQERWRKAALKNAFVLLSKHRHMDAACFFLLANSLKDCVNVLIRQIKDWDLAVGVCRIYEGDNGPILTNILQTHFLERGVQTGDRWLTSYVFWKSKAYTRAIQSLIKSPVDVLTEEEKKTISISFTDQGDPESLSKTFLEDDPLLIILYDQLREKNEAYFKGSLEIDSSLERDFLVRVARIYGRMGCDYLSVDLMKNWKFLNKDVIYKNSALLLGSSSISSSTVVAHHYNDHGNFAKFGFSPKLQRRSSILGTSNPTIIAPSTSSSSVSTNDSSSNGMATMSILEKYGLPKLPSNAQQLPNNINDTGNRKKNEENNEDEEGFKKKYKANFTAPPQSAFEEPDMSSFNFGF